MKISIGRTSGPCTDICLDVDFEPDEINVLGDVLAVVNKCTNNKEGWYYQTEDVVVHVRSLGGS